MDPDVLEWVNKAEGDWKVANRMLEDEDAVYDAVAFHSQQCAEKYLKARLVHEGIPFPKTHSLSALLNLIVAAEPSWESLRTELDLLSTRAVEIRYPGYFADREDAESALESAGRVRNLARISLERSSL